MFEEVVGQNTRDAIQQQSVDTLFTEKFVHIGTVAIKFLCEPRYGTPLTTQFLFDELTNVYHNKKQKRKPSDTYLSV